MKERIRRLVERREHLVALAAAQRMTLAHSIAPWRPTLARVDQGLAALRYLKRHPAWLAGGAAMLLAFRPGSVWKWLRRGWMAWRIVH